LPPDEAFLATDFAVMSDAVRRDALAAANELAPRHLSDQELQALIAFLHALTDPAMLDMRDTMPARVPSGLPIWD
jgi:cytochrome c peroxidase